MIKRVEEISLHGKEVRSQPIPVGWSSDLDLINSESAYNICLYGTNVSPYIGVTDAINYPCVIVSLCVWSPFNGTPANSRIIISDNKNLDETGELLFECIIRGTDPVCINNDCVGVGNWGGVWRSFNLYRIIRNTPFYIKYKHETQGGICHIQLRRLRV